jgi:hypothetical protein
MRIGGWGRRGHERAVSNAREAATALARARVEREEVELFLLTHQALRAPVVGAAPRPA